MAISETYKQKFNRLFNSISKKLKKSGEKKCHCGNLLPKKNGKPGKAPIYCAPRCRPSYKEKQTKNYNCTQCNIEFQGTTRGRASGKNVFCSSPCSSKFQQNKAKSASTVEKAMTETKPVKSINFDLVAVDEFPRVFSHPNEFNNATERVRKFFINVLAARAAKNFAEFRANGGMLTGRKYDRMKTVMFTSDGTLVKPRVETLYRTKNCAF